jgi:cysteine desulfurase
MRVNHEIGNITDVYAIGQLCQKYGAFFHSDTVQSLYCLEHDFSQLPMHLALGSAHKIHGPKGIGFAYIHPDASVAPLHHGGSQELNRRAGTENVPAIVGMATALELAVRDRAQIATHLQSIKKQMVAALQQQIPMVQFNGSSADETQSSPTILNISFPHCPDQDMLVYNLDIHGIAASTGSACTSGSNIGSQVVSALQTGTSHAIRFSFSRYTTHAEVAQTVAQLAKLCKG